MAHMGMANVHGLHFSRAAAPCTSYKMSTLGEEYCYWAIHSANAPEQIKPIFALQLETSASLGLLFADLYLLGGDLLPCRGHKAKVQLIFGGDQLLPCHVVDSNKTEALVQRHGTSIKVSI